ncbi:hypothetical protein MHYP_G00142970 [Metynnis hypsauchen]
MIALLVQLITTSENAAIQTPGHQTAASQQALEQSRRAVVTQCDAQFQHHQAASVELEHPQHINHGMLFPCSFQRTQLGFFERVVVHGHCDQ